MRQNSRLLCIFRIFTFLIYCSRSQYTDSTTIREKHIVNVNLCPEFKLDEIDSFSFNKTHHIDVPIHLIAPTYRRQNFTDVRFVLMRPVRDFTCQNPESQSVAVAVNLINKTRSVNFTPNGLFKYGTDIYDPTEYCVQNITNDTMYINICHKICQEDGGQSFCIPKCCNMGKVIQDLINISCVYNDAQTEWMPSVYSDVHTKLSKNEVQRLKPHFRIHHPSKWCNATMAADVYTLRDLPNQKRIPFRMLQNGLMMVKIKRIAWEPLPVRQYCIDLARFPDEFQDNLELNTIIIECSELRAPYKPPRYIWLYAASLFISAVCLAITIVINILVIENNDAQAHRWTRICYFGSFLCLQLCFGVGHIWPYLAGVSTTAPAPARYFCYAIAIGGHFFYICTFCWLTILAVDIWSTLRKMRPKSKQGFARFRLYLAFSLLIPSAIVALGLILENIYGEIVESTVIVPEYGKRSCFVEPIYASLYYVYIPTGILITINTCLFLLTCWNICIVQGSAKPALDNTATNGRANVFLFLKLYIIMGIPFVFDILSWYITKEDRVIPWYFILVDLFVIFQGITILYLFCLTSKTRTAILKKYPNLNRLLTCSLRSKPKAMAVEMTSLSPG